MKDEELKNVEKFVDYAQNRLNGLITINMAMDEEGISPRAKHVKELYINGLNYTSQKIREMFEDYKSGRVPTPFSIPLS